MSVWGRSLLAVGAIAVFFSGHIIYLSLYAVLLVYLLFGRLTRRALESLRPVREESALRLFPGERAEVAIRLENPSRVPIPWLVVEERADRELCQAGILRFAVALRGGAQASLSYSVRPARRGVYALGPLRMETADPFGVESHVREVEQRREVIVYPRVHDLAILGLPTHVVSGGWRSPRSPLVDPVRVAGVRDYIYGDPHRHIHWRATAHTGDFKVKQFEPVIHLDLAVFLDLCTEGYRAWNAERMAETAIETAASLLAAAARQRQGFGLYAAARLAGAHSVASGVQKGDTHLQRCLELLARISVTDRAAGIERELEEAFGRLRRDSAVAVVAPRASEALLAALLRMRGAGYRITFIQVSEEPDEVQLPPGIGTWRVARPAAVAGAGAAFA